MTDFRPRAARRAPAGDAPDSAASRRRLAFSGNKNFQLALKLRVDEYFAVPGRRRRDSVQWYLKAASILSLFLTSYVLLVFLVTAWWQATIVTLVLALSVAGIGFNIMHDAGHGAASRYRPINRLLAHSLDIVGGSSYLWRWKHGVLHHHYANITGHDTDIALGPLVRFTPHEVRYPHQRLQHWYVWLLYGLMAIKWQFYDDFRVLLKGKIGLHHIPRPRGTDLAMLVAAKLTFFVLAFVIPLSLHPFRAVLAFYVLFAVVLGLALSIVFQLAHCVEEADFPRVTAGTHSIDNAWAIHQVQTTINFSRGNRALTWLLGGLNYQIEHHLFPEVSHCHYPAVAVIVKQACADFGVRYQEHDSFWSGVCSHIRWLKRMGAAAPAATAVGLPA